MFIVQDIEKIALRRSAIFPEQHISLLRSEYLCVIIEAINMLLLRSKRNVAAPLKPCLRGPSTLDFQLLATHSL